MSNSNSCQSQRYFLTPPATWKTMKRHSPLLGSEKKPRRNSPSAPFHIIHNIPSGNSPYVRAKRIQLIDKNPSKAVSLFWAAINSGDRVVSALKDMATVMKQLDRSDEAIEAIKSFRHLCPPESQDSIDNVLIELYKQSGRIEEEIEILQQKVKRVEEGLFFSGKRTKMARCQGKMVQITVEKEYSRLLGNLAWAYMQEKDFKSAEEHYRKALSFGSDKNQQCNLALCLMHMNKFTEAKFLLQAIRSSSDNGLIDESYAKSYDRASQLLVELESQSVLKKPTKQAEHANGFGIDRGFVDEKPNKMEQVGGMDSDLCFQKSVDGLKSPPLPLFLNKMNRKAFGESPCEKKSDFYWRRNRDTGQEEADAGFRFQKSVDGLKSPPLPSFLNKTNRKAFGESPSEKKADFDWRRNRDMGQEEADCAIKRTYGSPFCRGGSSQKVPFTLPRQCSRPSTNGDHRNGRSGEGAHGGYRRKLSFVPSIDSEIASNADMPKVSPRISKKPMPSVCGDWRKNSLENYEEVNNELEQLLKSNEEKVNSMVCYGQEKPAAEKCEWPSDLPFSDNGTKNTKLSERYSGQSCNLLRAGSICPSDAEIVENLDRLRKTLEVSTWEHRRSWADVVEEEEEQGVETWREVFPQNYSGNTSRQSLFSYQIPGRSSMCSMNEERFNNEKGLMSLNQVQKLSQKIETIDLEESGYCSQPERTTSLMKESVSRSLCFDKNQKPAIGKNHCTSPLLMKSWNFGGSGLALSNYFSSGISEDQKDRLPTFHDLTHIPVSPRF